MARYGFDTRMTSKSFDKWQAYEAVYEQYFSKFQTTKSSILEIGVQNGGFTELLAKYFPLAKSIVGCDIDEKCGELEFEDPRINIVVGDASSESTAARIRKISKSYQLIIEDGSHRSSDIIKAFANYFPLLRTGGVFIAEDLHCSYWSSFEGGLFHEQSSISFFKRLADIVNHEHWGIPSQRGRILADIFDVYQIHIDEETLARVRSVSFVNSQCIIEKDTPEKVSLGRRKVSSQSHLVVDNTKFDNSSAIGFDQTSNPYSSLGLQQARLLTNVEKISRLPYQLTEVKEELNFQISELRGSVAQYESVVQESLKADPSSSEFAQELIATIADISGRVQSTEQRVEELLGLQSAIEGINGRLPGLERGMDELSEIKIINGDTRLRLEAMEPAIAEISSVQQDTSKLNQRLADVGESIANLSDAQKINSEIDRKVSNLVAQLDVVSERAHDTRQQWLENNHRLRHSITQVKNLIGNRADALACKVDARHLDEELMERLQAVEVSTDRKLDEAIQILQTIRAENDEKIAAVRHQMHSHFRWTFHGMVQGLSRRIVRLFRGG